MCDYEDIDQPFCRYDGIHYVNGDYQPFIPELAPPKPQFNSTKITDVMRAWDNVVKVEELFNRDDLFYRLLK